MCINCSYTLFQFVNTYFCFGVVAKQLNVTDATVFLVSIVKVRCSDVIFRVYLYCGTLEHLAETFILVQMLIRLGNFFYITKILNLQSEAWAITVTNA